MINVVMKPHTALFIAQPGAGITHKVLDLLENEYRHHFEYIIILCPTLRINETYRSRPWIWSDNNIFLIEPKDKLFKCIRLISKSLIKRETLFILDDIIADKSLDKKTSIIIRFSDLS